MQILSLFAWRERFLRVPGVLRNADLVAICVAREIFACPGNIAECRYRRYLRDVRDSRVSRVRQYRERCVSASPLCGRLRF